MAVNMSTSKMVGSNANLMMHQGQGMGGSPIHNPTGASPPPNYILNHHDRQGTFGIIQIILFEYYGL